MPEEPRGLYLEGLDENVESFRAKRLVLEAWETEVQL